MLVPGSSPGEPITQRGKTMAADNVNCEALRLVIAQANAGIVIRKGLGTRNEEKDALLETAIMMLQGHVDEHDEENKVKQTWIQ